MGGLGPQSNYLMIAFCPGPQPSSVMGKESIIISPIFYTFTHHLHILRIYTSELRYTNKMCPKSIQVYHAVQGLRHVCGLINGGNLLEGVNRLITLDDSHWAMLVLWWAQGDMVLVWHWFTKFQITIHVWSYILKFIRDILFIENIMGPMLQIQFLLISQSRKKNHSVTDTLDTHLHQGTRKCLQALVHMYKMIKFV